MVAHVTLRRGEALGVKRADVIESCGVGSAATGGSAAALPAVGKTAVEMAAGGGSTAAEAADMAVGPAGTFWSSISTISS